MDKELFELLDDILSVEAAIRAKSAKISYFFSEYATYDEIPRDDPRNLRGVIDNLSWAEEQLRRAHAILNALNETTRT